MSILTALRSVRAAPVVLAVTVTTALLGGGGAPAPDAAAAPRIRPVAAASAAVPCRPAVRACVRLSTNQAWLLRDGRVLAGPVGVSHGRPGYRTPPGTFRVSFKERDHTSSVFDASMPYSVFFNGGVAFHQGNPRVLSHGCVHLPRAAAQTFYGTLQPGDLVQVVA